MAKQIYSYPDLSNSIVLVTGANGGIGFDIVNSALQAGAKVLATDLVIGASLEKLNSNERFISKAYDLQDDSQCNECIAWSNSLGVNVLVNNAAIFDMAPFLESSLDQYDQLFSVNVRAMFAMMQGIAKGLDSRKEKGSIINFSATTGIVSARPNIYNGSHKHIGYTVSKAGLINLTKFLIKGKKRITL